jgi:putative ABC transport system ATP-binding protein
VITHNAAIAGMADRVISISGGQIARVETNTARLRPRDIVW